jgi:hypothetical protein
VQRIASPRYVQGSEGIQQAFEQDFGKDSEDR